MRRQANRYHILTGVSYLLVIVAALIPRVASLDRFLTVDETNFWIPRSEAFLNALRAGDPALTAISPHPGVTTMWSGAIGILLRRPLFESGLLQNLTVPGAIALMRLPLSIAHAAGIVICFMLLRRMLPHPLALLAALLWAFDPFLVAYSRLLHVDAPLTTFAAVAMLAALRYWYGPRHLATLLLAGIATGLALLSKSPSLALIPIIGAVALTAPKTQGEPNHRTTEPQNRPPTTDHRPPQNPETPQVDTRTKNPEPIIGDGNERTTIRNTEYGIQDTHNQSSSIVHRPSSINLDRVTILSLLGWGFVALIMMLALWPGLWAAPLKIYELIQLGVEGEAAQPHMLGNYFLGQATEVPGVTFYPVTIALRLTPWGLVGLLALALPPIWRRIPVEQHRILAALAAYVLVFTVALTIFPKKFNRYLLPAFPALDILAAAGIWYAGVMLMGTLHRYQAKWLPALLGTVTALAGLINLAWWHPYEITAFNQALGGARAGAWAFVIGWGEGLELVAGWLNDQPNITGVATVSRLPGVQNPYMRDGADATTPDAGSLPSAAGYVVIYVSQTQRGEISPPFNQFYQRAIPLKTFVIHDVEYAWIYQVPPAVAAPREARFGEAIRLLGFSTETEIKPGTTISTQLVWGIDAPPPHDYTLFAHLIGQDGRRVAQVDLPYSTATWEAGRYLTTDLPITLPADLPQGDYRLLIGLYDPTNGQRLAISGATPADPALSGDHALLLTTIQIP